MRTHVQVQVLIHGSWPVIIGDAININGQWNDSLIVIQ
jgi:hypothetical protein